MTILGIDPGIGRTGWAIVSSEKGKIIALDFGCIETESKTQEYKRLKIIFKEIESIIKKYSPDSLAIEKLFFNKNVTSAFSVGQARGVVLLAAANRGLTIAEFTPLQVKVAVTGYGKAQKPQIGQMIKTIFKLAEVPTPDDTADALAVALTHAVSYKLSTLA